MLFSLTKTITKITRNEKITIPLTKTKTKTKKYWKLKLNLNGKIENDWKLKRNNLQLKLNVNVESVEPPLKRFKFLQQQLSISHSQSTSVGVGPETELANYSAELCSTTVINCSATEFWQGREAGYPLLSKIALDLISAPASQAYTERVFSVCGGSDGGQAQQDDQRAWTACFPAIELEIRLNSELIQLNWTEQNCDEPVDCTELVTIVRDWEWECCWWWWHWVIMIMIMMSHAMYCKCVTSTR